MSAEAIRGLAKNNDTYIKTHQTPPSFANSPNIKGMLVVSCMDPRSNPNEFWSFGLQGGAVIRNAGGRVTEDVLRSIRTLTGIMSNGRNTVGAVAVVHHTDCGLANFGNGEVANLLKQHAHLEGETAKEVERMDFGSWKEHANNPEESVKRDMKIIKADPYLPKDIEVVGYVLDTFTGKTTEVAAM